MSAVSRDKTFLNYFYDLASNEKQTRLNAANSLMIYIRTCVKNKQNSDPEYAMKRLVRGLASSRESARQGFAICLCELLTMPEMEVSTTLQLLDDNTKLSGSLKGAEERDFMFGKLFCYLAVLRSGKVAKDVDASVKILERILELHAKRGWIREVASEAVLVFMSTASADTVKAAVPKVLPLLSDISLSELAAWQLMLLIGLQNLAAKNSVFKACWEELSSDVAKFSMAQLDDVTATLSAATAGFPKMHRVWDFVLSQVFPMDGDRVLKNHRLKSLAASQESSLVSLARFIDQHLISSSKEKRSVAMTLATTLVRLTPAEFLPIALTKSMVRSICAARVTKKHALYHLAGSVLEAFVESAVGDTQSRIALVSVLVQFGGASFDSRTGSKTVATLLEGMQAGEIASHVQLLCSVIGSTATESDKVSKMDVDDGEDNDEAENTQEEESSATTAIAAIEALTSIAKNGRLAGRSDICAQVIAVLVRLACFEQGVTKPFKVPSAAVVTATPKKGSKGKRKNSDLDSEADAAAAAVMNASSSSYPNASTIECVRVSESVLNTASGSDEIVEAASVKLLALMADIGAMTLQQLDKKASSVPATATDDKESKEVDTTPTVLQIAWQTVSHLMKSGGLTLRNVSGADSEGQREDVEEGENPLSPAEFIQKIEAAVKSNNSLIVTKQSSDATAHKANVSRNRLVEALNALLTQAAFFALTSVEVEVQTVLDIAAIVPQLVSGTSVKESPAAASNGDDEDDDDGEIDALLPLFEHCMDMLAVPSEHSIKGLRDAIKRVWTAVCYIQGDDISLDVIDCVVAVVIGDDADEETDSESHAQGEQDHEQEDGDDEEDEDEDDDDGSESEEEETPAPTPAKKQNDKAKTPAKSVAPASTKKSAKKGTATADNEDDEIILSEDAGLDLLAVNVDDLGDDEFESDLVQSMGLQHSVEHDDALAQMIALRKQNRKSGLLQARRRQMLIRSRAVDILEIIINRVELGDLLYPMYLPLLKCLSRCTGSTLTQSLAEGKTYTHRLGALLEQKLCKKKFRLIGDGDESAESAIVEESTLLLTHLTKQMVSPYPSLRQVAHSCLLSVARAIISSDCAEAKTLLLNTVAPLFTTYSTKKNHRVPTKLIDDLLLNRFTDFFAPSLLPQTIAAIGAAKLNTFTRAELCRILGGLLRKYNSVSESVKTIFNQSVTAMVASLTAAVEAIASTSSEESINNKSKDSTAAAAASGFNAKRFKPVLLCIKEVLEFAKRNKLDTAAVNELAAPTTVGKKDKKGSAPSSSSSGQKQSSAHLLSSVQSLQSTLNKHQAQSTTTSPVIAALVKQIATLVTGMQQSGAAPSSGSGNAKQQGELSAESSVKGNSNKQQKRKQAAEDADEGAVYDQAEKAVWGTKEEEKKKSKKQKK